MIKTSLGAVVLALALADVTSWTIDLPEARKYLFEKNDRLEKLHKEQHREEDAARRVLFSNREDSNSRHHDEHHGEPREEHRARDSYAKSYGYQSYMEKKVRDIVYDGSEYLGGLQRSLENFTRLLQNCSRDDQQNVGFFNETVFNATAFSAAPFNGSLPSPPAPPSPPWQPLLERAPSNLTAGANSTEQCRRATRASEHVRRFAELAIKVTKDLQDVAYSRKYLKDDPYELSQEENELILRLAWFLDRLGYYTDFHPEPKRFPEQSSTSTTTAPAPVSMVNVSDATKLMMMKCLKQKSLVPATIRCAVPQEVPSVVPFVAQNLNPVPGSMPSASSRRERVLPAATSEQELLLATDDWPHHHLTAVRHVAKRAAAEPREDPATAFLEYFVKHKVWEGSNPTAPDGEGFRQFEVSNEIPHRLRKRELGKTVQIPEDPFQDLSKYARNKKGVHRVKDEAQAQRVRAFVAKAGSAKPSSPKELPRRLAKLLRSRRSYTYEKDADRPRRPDDLFEDISYYVKNREGTNFNRDLAQAAQLRAGLELIFQNPNILVVRQYGANYNPAVPDPLIGGALRGAADN